VNEEDLAYTAGFFDAEGSISISKCGRYYELSVSISNTNLPAMERIQPIVGSHLIKRAHKQGRYTQFFMLELFHQKAKSFLEKIVPYLCIKKEQAIIALEFQSKMKNGKLTISETEKEKYRIQINSSYRKRNSANADSFKLLSIPKVIHGLR